MSDGAVQPNNRGDLLRPELRIGDVVAGKFVVERKIGAGGMGQVVIARHQELKSQVAIKVMHGMFVRDAEAVERFKREARAMATLKSEHAVRVYDVGETDTGLPYMIMELLEGRDAASELRERGPTIPIDEVLGWMTQVCEALREAHEAGIVHRDLKPQNIFLSRRRSGEVHVRVLDFGIAKAFGARTTQLTKAGDMLGTSQYMAPEQVRCDAVDGRTDVWGAGACLFRFLTAEYPFPGPGAPMICAGIVESAPQEMRTFRPQIPARLDTLVKRCLAKDPAQRPRDMRVLIDELREIRVSLQQDPQSTTDPLIGPGGGGAGGDPPPPTTTSPTTNPMNTTLRTDAAAPHAELAPPLSTTIVVAEPRGGARHERVDFSGSATLLAATNAERTMTSVVAPTPAPPAPLPPLAGTLPLGAITPPLAATLPLGAPAAPHPRSSFAEPPPETGPFFSGAYPHVEPMVAGAGHESDEIPLNDGGGRGWMLVIAVLSGVVLGVGVIAFFLHQRAKRPDLSSITAPTTTAPTPIDKPEAPPEAPPPPLVVGSTEAPIAAPQASATPAAIATTTPTTTNASATTTTTPVEPKRVGTTSGTAQQRASSTSTSTSNAAATTASARGKAPPPPAPSGQAGLYDHL